MGFNKNFTANDGNTASYTKITEVKEDYIADRVYVTMRSYKSKTDADNGMAPCALVPWSDMFEMKDLPDGADTREKAYTHIKAIDDNFKDATKE